MAGIVRHGTVTIRFDPKKLNGYAKFQFEAAQIGMVPSVIELEIPTMHLLGAMAKLLQGVHQCVEETIQHIDPAKEV